MSENRARVYRTSRGWWAWMHNTCRRDSQCAHCKDGRFATMADAMDSARRHLALTCPGPGGY